MGLLHTNPLVAVFWDLLSNQERQQALVPTAWWGPLTAVVSDCP